MCFRDSSCGVRGVSRRRRAPENQFRKQEPDLQRRPDQRGTAYNPETGVFTAPVRGVYYVRFTANAPTDFPMSAVLYRNDQHIELIAHEQPSGSGSDTASNGAACCWSAETHCRWFCGTRRRSGQLQPPQHLQRVPALPTKDG
uniref:C1q domain-containing protein n=1 Tax=Neogobius melanostomus TaxID=47308 RepID=A0A8C6S5L0_9GOBI